MLLMASIRDILLMQRESIARSEVLRRINDVLFCGKRNEVIRECAQFVRSNKYNYPDGRILAHSRLTPSHQDRAAFYTLITHGAIAHQLNASIELSIDSNNHMAITKTTFDSLCREYIRSSDDREIVSAMKHLVNRCLDFFFIMYMELKNEINMPQLYLWMQEKSLFSLGSLLHNPAPGIRFLAIDLVRNLLISPIISLPQIEQESFYNLHWLPLENRFENASLFDKFLAQFVANRKANEQTRFPRGSFESMISAMLDRNFDKFKGLFGYAEFHSYVEHYHALHNTDVLTTSAGVLHELLLFKQAE
jgi:hypothetical protein